MQTPKLGQHFLTRPEVARTIATSVTLPEGYTVLEIGPGKGILTRELLALGYRVIALEKDPMLFSKLQDTFRVEIETGALTLLQEDVRSFDTASCPHLTTPYALIANIPYYITGRIIRIFLTAPHQPTHIVLLLQKEVAQRIVARDGKQSILSLSVSLYGTPLLKKTIKPGAFSPPPKVDSAILVIEDISKKHISNQEMEIGYFSLIKKAFSQKRKMIGASLKGMVSELMFEDCHIPKTARPEDIPLEKWGCLAERITRD